MRLEFPLMRCKILFMPPTLPSFSIKIANSPFSKPPIINSPFPTWPFNQHSTQHTYISPKWHTFISISNRFFWLNFPTNLSPYHDIAIESSNSPKINTSFPNGKPFCLISSLKVSGDSNLNSILYNVKSVWPGLSFGRLVGLVCRSLFPKRAGSYPSMLLSEHLLIY